MSKKNHVLIPRGFSPVGDVPREALTKFHHMTGAECRLLAEDGRIEEIGPKLWRLTPSCDTALASVTGNGLLSVQISSSLRVILRYEMAGRAGSRKVK